MNNITKVSDITYTDIADYCRIGETDADTVNTLKTLLTVSKAYITQYTGKTLAELDDLQDVIICVLILCQDMWDNRTLYVDKSNANKVVESILSLHAENLL